MLFWHNAWWTLAKSRNVRYFWPVGGLFYMSTDKRKQSLYFPETMLKDSSSAKPTVWIVLSLKSRSAACASVCWSWKKLPSTDEPAHPPS